MSKEYPSNLTCDQLDLLSDLLPSAKPGGRPRTVDVDAVINAILYVLVEGIRWHALPGDFPPWQTVYTYFRNWRKDGTWQRIHDRLREWYRIEQGREKSLSEAVIDSQSVKSAAGVNDAVGYDAGKRIQGRKRFLAVETLGLVGRVRDGGEYPRTGRGQNLALSGQSLSPPKYPATGDDLGRRWF